MFQIFYVNLILQPNSKLALPTLFKEEPLKFRGFPIMRTITATTAFKMPLYGISFSLSAFSVSSTVFRNTEKLSCANEVSASKPLFTIKACFYPTEVFPAANFPFFSDFKAQIHCVLKNCINPILQPRSPAMDYCGCFFALNNIESR